MQLPPALSRRRLLTGFACLSAEAAFAPCCGGFAAPAAPAPPFKLKQIARGVYAYGGVNQPMTPENRGAIANLGLVVGDSAAAVIDSGGSLAEAHAFRQAIAEVTDRPLRYLIATTCIRTIFSATRCFATKALRWSATTICRPRSRRAALSISKAIGGSWVPL